MNRFSRTGKNSVSRCPGEECGYFAKTDKTRTWEERTKDACTNCPRCKGNGPLNPDGEQEPDATNRIERLINRAEYLRAAKRGGFDISENRITPLEFKTVVLLERMEKDWVDFERGQMLETMQILRAAFTAK